MNPHHESRVSIDNGAVTHPLPSGILTERNIRVKMRDGVHLSATVWRPDAEGQFPVVLCVTAYGKDFGPAEYSTLPKIKKAGMAVGTMHISEVTTWEGPDPGFWVPNGYAVVVADPRGFYESEGEYGIYSQEDTDDYADLIEWAGTQEWSSGSVGLNGVSYLAINQWMLSTRAKPPHLKAITPWEGHNDFFREVVNHGGIPETRFLQAWYTGSLPRGVGERVITEGPLKLEATMKAPFVLENVEVPALICASWSDHGLHTRGGFEAFMRISSTHKWLYTHGGNKWEVYYSEDALEWQKSFFDYFLKGIDNGFVNRPAVRLEVRDTREDFEVRGEESWPLEGTDFTQCYLDLERGTLAREIPQKAQSRMYEAETNETVELNLTFEERIEVTGPMVLKLWVSALDADDLDLFVAVRKFDRDGQEIHFCGKDGFREGVVALGWLRVSQRHKDSDRSTPWRPFLSHDRSEKVSPSEVVPVEIEILPSSTVFDAGETLRLVISGKDIIEHSRFGHDDSVNAGRHQLHAGASYPSYLLVPFIGRDRK